MRITLNAWRQPGPPAKGAFETYDVHGGAPKCRSSRCSTS